jgi:hypothetical protein
MQEIITYTPYASACALAIAAILLVGMVRRIRQLEGSIDDAHRIALSKTVKSLEPEIDVDHHHFESELLGLLRWVADSNQTTNQQENLQKIIELISVWHQKTNQPHQIGTIDLSKVLQHKIQVVRASNRHGLQIVMTAPHKLQVTQSVPHIELITYLILALASEWSRATVLCSVTREPKTGNAVLTVEYGTALINAVHQHDHYAFGANNRKIGFTERYHRAHFALIKHAARSIRGSCTIHTTRTEGTQLRITVPSLHSTHR